MTVSLFSKIDDTEISDPPSFNGTWPLNLPTSGDPPEPGSVVF